MKPSEMRELGADKFASEIESRKKELMELRFQAAMGNFGPATPRDAAAPRSGPAQYHPA